MVKFTIYYVLVHTIMLSSFMLSCMLLTAWSRSSYKEKMRIFSFLNRLHGRWIFLTLISVLNWAGVLFWVMHVFFLSDAMSWQWYSHFTEQNELATPIGIVDHAISNVWFFMLIIGIVSAKGSLLISRAVGVLFNDYLGVAPNGEWGPVSQRLDIN